MSEYEDPVAELAIRVNGEYKRRFVHPKDPADFQVAIDWRRVPRSIATACLRALDEGTVFERHRSFGLPRDLPHAHPTMFQTKKSGKELSFLYEAPIEIGAAGELQLDRGWPVERLGFRSGGEAAEAFDLMAYGKTGGCVIATEAKADQREVDQLAEDLKACIGDGLHDLVHCAVAKGKKGGRNANHHKKFDGLVKMRPELLWIVGPRASKVFKVTYEADGLPELSRSVKKSLSFNEIHSAGGDG